MSEIVSTTLVKSAEINFTDRPTSRKTKNTKQKKSLVKNKFSDELKGAYSIHKRICNEWRKAGRPSDSTNPYKKAKLDSQRNLQNIRRQENSNKTIELNDDLMNAHGENMSSIFQKLKKLRGDQKQNIEIPFIETLAGKYEGNNVLEGFRVNTEIF